MPRQEPYTETSIDEARKRRNEAQDKLQQAELQAQAELNNRALGYMHHDARSRHITAVNEQLNQAKEAYRLADAAFQTVNNDPLARSLVAQHRANTQAAERQKQRDAEQTEFAKEQEAQAKEAHRSRYLAVGGTLAQFEAAWPGIWSREIESRAAQQQDAMTQRLLASGRYLKI